MEQYNLKLKVLDDDFCICRMEPCATLPAWITAGTFFSVTRTEEELSIVCSRNIIPEDARSQMVCEREWKCMKVEGPLDLSLTGILAHLSSTLADAGISIFAISTYDTDYLLVKEEKLHNAIIVLMSHGYSVDR